MKNELRKKLSVFPVLGLFFCRWSMFENYSIYIAYMHYQTLCLMLVAIFSVIRILEPYLHLR